MASTNRSPCPLNLTTLSTPTLASSPHLPNLYTLINHAFAHSHETEHSTILLTEKRLQAPAQLIEEIGPDGFCILAFTVPDTETHGDGENEGRRLIATASAKPYYTPGSEKKVTGENGGGMMSDVNKMFKRTGAVLPIPPLPTANASSNDKAGNSPDGEEEEEEKGEGNLPSWEILAMAVTPELQGRGIASQLLNLTIETIRAQVKEEQLSGIVEKGKEDGEGKVIRKGEGGEGGKVKILLSTLKELKEEYYKRKGWKTTHERRFPAGVGGSEAGFGVVDMVRVV